MTYDVALLIERQINALDADQVVALHEELTDEHDIVYHLLLPIENSARTMMAAMTSLGGGQLVPLGDPENIDELEREIHTAGQDELDASTSLIRERGQSCTSQLTEDDPVDALTALVQSYDAAEVIILTQSHVVREFLHVDWSSRAKRRLNVPTLHLLEHMPFDAQR